MASPRAPVSLRALALVATGAAAGSAARYAALLAGSGDPMLVNVAGCLVLGLLLPRATPDLRLLLGVGFLGGFTTLGAVASAAAVDALAGGPLLAVARLALDLGASLAAYAVGHRLGHAGAGRSVAHG